MNDNNLPSLHKINRQGEVFVIMAVEVMKKMDQSAERFTCYCVCDTHDTATRVLDKDTERGDIRPGGYILSHVLQTAELV